MPHVSAPASSGRWCPVSPFSGPVPERRPAHTRALRGPGGYGLGDDQSRAAREDTAAEQVPGQLDIDAELAPTDALDPQPQPEGETDPPAEAEAASLVVELADPRGERVAAVRQQALDDGVPPVLVDEAAAAGLRIRAEREARAGKAATPRHGRGWLDVEAFTEHLRTARFRPLDPGTVTVNVRVSSTLGPLLESYLDDVDVAKRVVVESLLVELLGPAQAGGAR